MILQKANSILIILTIIFFYSCKQESHSTNLNFKGKNNNKLDVVPSNCDLMFKLLKTSPLVHQEWKEIDSLASPLRISKNFELLSLKGLKVQKYIYEKWFYGIDNLEIWTFKFSEKEDRIVLESRIEKLCNSKSIEKNGFRKMFRGYKFCNNSLVLFKHNFFSDEKVKKYQGIVDFIDQDFNCW